MSDRAGMEHDTPSSPQRREHGSRHTEERRVVTTLFCDLVGFTALSEQNDPEVVGGFLRRYHALAREVIESYGGTVEKYIGDAVVAVFGLPVLHEDDAERAVRAALRLVDEVEALPGVAGRGVEVRVGVNTGEALVRLQVDPASGEGFLTGDAVNVAARLQAAAPTMAVAVGAATHAATAKVFSFEPCHPVALKGKANPLEAWIATEALARTGPGLRSFASEFVGRVDELAALRQALDRVAGTRRPGFALVTGEPGIGKSRLLAEFARGLDVRPEAVAWHQGRCLPFGANVTFSALSEIVRDAAGVLEGDSVTRTEARLEAVLPDVPDRELARSRVRPLLGLEAGEASREENFEAWRQFLEGLASGPPVVLAVEDLHWADEAMLAFMDHLAESDSAVPLLVLASARPEALEAAGPGSGFVAAATHILLSPLSGEETAELARAHLGAKSLPADLQALILDRSGGNPFFAEELVRLLQDGALIQSHGGKVTLKPGAAIPLPHSIGALIAARLELLSPERKALLADAAVVGRNFWAGAVAAVGSHEVAEVFEGFYDLVAKELVRPERGSSFEGETEFAFVHALVCEVAYSQLTLADRAAKHAALARWFEERVTGRGEDLAEVLAFHYGTALENASAAGLFELVDELEEPTTRYLELAGGRAAPLDSAAAAAHFARAESVAREAARPKRRFFLSRRARRTIRRRTPLLVAAAAVIVVAVVASLVAYQFRPGPGTAAATPLTPEQIAAKYGSGLVRITARVPRAADGPLTWIKRVGVGFVAGEDGLIVTSSATVDDASRRGPMVRGLYNGYPLWVTCEFWDRQGRRTRTRGLVVYDDPGLYGVAFISVDPAKVRLSPIPVGDPNVAHAGMQVVALRFLGTMPHGIPAGNAMTLTDVWRDAGPTGKTVAAMRTDPQLSPTDTGAPLFDPVAGKVIGWAGPVPALFYNDATGDHSSPTDGSAMSVAYLQGARVFMGQVTRGTKNWLGLRSSDTQVPSIARALGLPTANGVLVEWVDPSGPAARAGIRGGTRVKIVAAEQTGWVQYITGGDLIVAVDGRTVRDTTDFMRILARHRPGDTVAVRLWRDGRMLSVRTKVLRYPYATRGA
jgi:class 3 adenylate cyclase/S1-C subfamily serine protease